MPETTSSSFNYFDVSPFTPYVTPPRESKFKIGDICRVVRTGGYNDVSYPIVGRIVKIETLGSYYGNHTEYSVKWFINGEWEPFPPEIEGNLVRDNNLEIYHREEMFEFSLPKGDVFVIPKKKVLSVKDETIQTNEPMVVEYKEGDLPLYTPKYKKVKIFTVEV